jgi:putative transposase
MPRTARAAAGGLVYHVLNRGNGRMKIFRTPEDYAAFVALLIDAKSRADVEVLGFCLMPNHWHLALRPKRDGDLAAFMSWLTNTHVKRYRSHYRQTSGHLYQGRYKSFPVEVDEYFLALLRFVESNPRRAKLVKRAQDWPWSSLGCTRQIAQKLLDEWPLERPRGWAALVNEPVSETDRAKILAGIVRGRPLGSDRWTAKTATRLGLSYTLNPRGRPKKEPGKRK